MAAFTVPTYDQPLDNILGDFGVSFPVSFTVIINTSDVVTPYPGAEGLLDPDQIFSVAKAGSGDDGYAVFRQGRTYTINGTEQTQLTTAGYGAHIV